MYPLKQGLKLGLVDVDAEEAGMSLPMYPLKQGLKHRISYIRDYSPYKSLPMYPLKQGLKRKEGVAGCFAEGVFTHVSIKTRIETRRYATGEAAA